MKEEKGITLASLIVYIIATITVLSVLAAIIANFTSNLSTLSTEKSIEQKLGNFNLYFIKDVKEIGNSVDEIGQDGSWIRFSNGDAYELQNEKIIFFDSNHIAMTLLEDVDTCTFSIDNNNPNKINVFIELSDSTRKTLSYIMGNISEETGQEEFVYNYVIDTKTVTDEEKITAMSPVGLNLIDYKIYGSSTNPSLSLGYLVTDVLDTNYGKYRISIKISNGEEIVDKIIYLTEPLRRVSDSYVDYIDFINQKIVRNVGYIASYNNETITTPYMSTGGLTAGSAVIYGLEQPVEEDIVLPALKTFKNADTTYAILKNDRRDPIPSKMCISYYKNEK